MIPAKLIIFSSIENRQSFDPESKSVDLEVIQLTYVTYNMQIEVLNFVIDFTFFDLLEAGQKIFYSSTDLLEMGEDRFRLA